MEDPITFDVDTMKGVLTSLGLVGVITFGAVIYAAKRLYKGFRG